MRRLRSLYPLKSLGLEFWLPLPILAIAFWSGGGAIADKILQRSYYVTTPIQANAQVQEQPTKVILSIGVEIKYHRGFSKVKVKTANSALKKLEFEFPFTEVSQIEIALSRELGLSLEQIQKTVHYQVDFR
ncbi:hypothetical protein B7486_28175 [cyanobacterium TDX16]|uniref:Uncharacterized protein n=1 Tax=Scytonema millei VB511283 TaxID=1245923 RepID=A0A9X5E1I0_9CYAN|nr:hypothetical protein [Scytonema millei]NHC33593.1 hypothetical protein [Scytonema millei VB511283]OWY68060.1 hypothetical protein B7486_28175 [cyanobacterium TDX16]